MVRRKMRILRARGSHLPESFPGDFFGFHRSIQKQDLLKIHEKPWSSHLRKKNPTSLWLLHRLFWNPSPQPSTLKAVGDGRMVCCGTVGSGRSSQRTLSFFTAARRLCWISEFSGKCDHGNKHRYFSNDIKNDPFCIDEMFLSKKMVKFFQCGPGLAWQRRSRLTLCTFKRFLRLPATLALQLGPKTERLV